MGFQNCNMCDKNMGTVPPRFCEHFHVVCDNCLGFIQEERTRKSQPFARWNCPIEYGDQVCNAYVFAEADLKTPNYLELILSNWQFNCSSEMYGCTYIGTGYEVLKHEKECNWKNHRACPVDIDDKGSPCSEEFYAHLHLVQHMIETHNTTGSGNQLVLPLEFKEESVSDGKWRQIRCSLIGDGKQSYYLLFVAEAGAYLRIWLTEVDLKGDSSKKRQFVMRIPAPLPSVPHMNVKYEFTCNILPFATREFSQDDDENVDKFVEVEKKFLRRIADEKKDGKVKFQVLLQFLQNPPVTDDKGSAGATTAVTANGSDSSSSSSEQQSSHPKSASFGTGADQQSSPPESPESPPQRNARRSGAAVTPGRSSVTFKTRVALPNQRCVGGSPQPSQVQPPQVSLQPWSPPHGLPAPDSPELLSNILRRLVFNRDEDEPSSLSYPFSPPDSPAPHPNVLRNLVLNRDEPSSLSFPLSPPGSPAPHPNAIRSLIPNRDELGVEQRNAYYNDFYGKL